MLASSKLLLLIYCSKVVCCVCNSENASTGIGIDESVVLRLIEEEIESRAQSVFSIHIQNWYTLFEMQYSFSDYLKTNSF